MLATGKGEILSSVSLDLKNWHIVVVHPGIHVSTPLAYSWVKPALMKFDLVKQLTTTTPEKWRDVIDNNFEHGVFAHHPEVDAIKQQLYTMGAAYVSMSGSGSAVYGLFQQKPQHQQWNYNYMVLEAVL
jgi:4-diphosphocytidyl-2-C-methyl-D-erythritol kinase